MIDIYRRTTTDPEKERLYEAIEKALGFKLFAWQKIFIERGNFRCFGATTAEILKDLLEVDAPPLDYSKTRGTREEIYKHELKKIKQKLDSEGIPTRTVFFTLEQKKKYEQSQQFTAAVFDNMASSEIKSHIKTTKKRN